MSWQLRLSDRVVDLDTGRIDSGGELRSMELKLLRHLTEHAGRLVAHQDLLGSVWGYAAGVKTRTVYSTLHRIRQALEADPKAPVHICTVPGKGVMLVAGPSGSNLCPALDPFVGQAGLLRALRESPSRLTTLIGPGGAGKTRLAREYATQEQENFPGGCWFIDLTEDRTVDDAQSRFSAILPDLAVLPGRTLAILDNAESIGPDLGPTLLEWLNQAPSLHLLVTAQIPLGIAGELRMPLRGLPPSEAAELFCMRAKSIRPDFAPDTALEPLLEALDYLPLAIELAAAHAAFLGPKAILEGLDLHPLAAVRQDRPARHRSLSDLVAWTWQRLDPTLQHALVQCCQFESPVDLETVRSVLGAGGPAQLMALMERGLMREASAAGRFHPLWNVRRYVSEQGPHPEARARVVDHYRERGRALLALQGGFPPKRDPTEGAETPDILSAAFEALTVDPESAVPLVLWAQISATGRHAASAKTLTDQALSADLSSWSALLVTLRRLSSMPRAEADALVLEAASHGRPAFAAWLALQNAIHRVNEGHTAHAAACLDQADRWWSEVSSCPPQLEATFLGQAANIRGSISLARSDHDAESWFRKAEFHHQGTPEAAAVTMNIAQALRDQGRLRDAESEVRRAMDGLPPRWRVQRAIAFLILAEILTLKGEIEEARDLLDGALELIPDLSHHVVYALLQIRWAELHLDAGEVDAARRVALDVARRPTAKEPAVFVELALLRGRLADHDAHDCQSLLEEALNTARLMQNRRLVQRIEARLGPSR